MTARPRPILSALVILLACAPATRAPIPPARLSENDALALHVLKRLTFGPRPGEVEEVARTGVDRWIERQLHPETIADSAGAAALDGCLAWTEPVDVAATRLSGSSSIPGGMITGRVSGVVIILSNPVDVVSRDSARRSGPIGDVYLENGQMLACRLARVERSERQLLEVMTDFWENHFYIQGAGFPSRGSLIEWDRAVIGPNALGRFRDLLGAVAQNPAMLQYLDNTASRRDSLNENFARELLELHTMGVDGGYTQQDVIEVARAFTGWTHNRVRGGATRRSQPQGRAQFVFNAQAHDTAAKVFLGRALPAGRGMADGLDVLDMLARHPATAHHIARKLAVRFVSDDPPAALVDRAARVFLDTDGDIREVVRAIVTSPEFSAPEARNARVRSPLELVLATRRALDAPIDTGAEIIDLLIRLEQAPFAHPAPDGWPETDAGWVSAASVIERLNVAVEIAHGELPSIPLEAWPAWESLSTQPLDAQVDGVIRTLLHGGASPELRAAMRAYRPARAVARGTDTRQRTLRDLVALALGSPEFQRR